MATYRNSKFMTDAMLDNVTSLGVHPNTPVSNLARSGQLGTGIRFTKLDGATPAVFNPAVIVVLTVPSMWDKWPKLQEMLRAVVETHASSWTGLDFSYTVETQDTPVGHDGQVMKFPTRTTRAGVDPSMTVIEYAGMPIYNLFRTWMFDIQHPDTNASILPANLSEASDIPAWFMSAYTMSMAAIQYDPTGLPDRIYDCAIYTNMFPVSIGDIGIQRTIGTTEKKERTIGFTGLVQHNENTREFGMMLAEALSLHKINYNFALPGLTGESNPNLAIQKELRSFGGIEYEATGGNSGVSGAVEQFHFLGTGGNDAYSDKIEGHDDTIKATGAAVNGAGTSTQSASNSGGTMMAQNDTGNRFG